MAIVVPIGLDHIVLMTTSHEKMRRFYCNILGCSLERAQPEYCLLQLRAGDHLIDLIEDKTYIAPERGNVAHFCIRIQESDFDALARGMQDCGLTLLQYAKRTNATGGLGFSCYLYDPEGNQIELALGHHKHTTRR